MFESSMTEGKNAATDHDRVGLDKAFKRAIEEATQSDDEGQLPRAYGEYGTTLAKLGDNKKAEKELEKSIQEYQKLLAAIRSTTDRADVSEQLLKVRETLVTVLVAQNKLEAAEKVARANLDDSRQLIGSFRLNNTVEELYLDVLKKEGKTKEVEEFETEMTMNAIDENKHTLQSKASELLATGKIEEAEKQLITNAKRLERRNPQEAAWSRERLDILNLLMGKGTVIAVDEDVLRSHQARLDEARQIYKKDKAQINRNYLAHCLAIHGLLQLDKNPKEGRTIIDQALSMDRWTVSTDMLDYADDLRVVVALADPTKISRERIKKLLNRLETIYDTMQACGVDKLVKEKNSTRYYNHLGARSWTYAALDKNDKAIATFYEYFKTADSPRDERNMGHFLHVLMLAHRKEEAKAQFKEIVKYEKSRATRPELSEREPGLIGISALIDISAYGLDLNQKDDVAYLLDLVKTSPYYGQLHPLRKKIFKALQERLNSPASSSAANNH